MRILKTALAVVLCVLISRILKLEYAFYASIAAIITMENTVSNSFNAGKNRMLGTLVGALIGFLCASIMPGNAILCGLGIIVVIYLCNFLKWSKSVSIACIVFLAIMINLDGKNPVFYSLNRIVDTFMGIIIAVLINYFIVPPNNIKKIHEGCLKLIENMEKLVDEKIVNIDETDLRSLSSSLFELQKDILVHENEFRIRKDKVNELDDINKIVSILFNILSHLKVVMNLEEKYRENPEERLNNIDDFYNYNVEEIVNDLIKVRELI